MGSKSLEIDRNWKLLSQTLQSRIDGYCGTEQLLADFFDDYEIDGEELSKQNGFQNFAELLGSKVLTKYVHLETNQRGETVYKARYDPRTVHIREEQQKSLHNRHMKDARLEREFERCESSRDKMIGNKSRNIIASSENFTGRGFLNYGDKNNLAEGTIFDDCVQPPKMNTAKSHIAPVIHGSAGTKKMHEKPAINWEDEVYEDDNSMIDFNPAKGHAAGKENAKKSIDKQQYTKRGDGEYTDEDESDDDDYDDDHTTTRNNSKYVHKATVRMSPLSDDCVPVAKKNTIVYDHPVPSMPQTAECSNFQAKPFDDSVCIQEQSQVKNVQKCHGEKWLFQVAEEQKLKKSSAFLQSDREKHRSTFENNAFDEGRNRTSIVDAARAKAVTSGFIVDVTPDKKSSTVPFFSTARDDLHEEVSNVNHIRRSESVSSMVSSAARRRTRNLNEDDLAKIGVLVGSIVKYYYPRAILLHDLLQAMEFIEPRFVRLEDSSNWKYSDFLNQWCDDVKVIGKPGKENLLWNEQ